MQYPSRLQDICYGKELTGDIFKYRSIEAHERERERGNTLKKGAGGEGRFSTGGKRVLLSCIYMGGCYTPGGPIRNWFGNGFLIYRNEKN
jgi:hypothetical protein